MIDEELVRMLIRTQFPHWADLPVTRVEPGGVDNRTFRLGPKMSVRLPSGDWYALQVDKEQRWLPVLAPHLPVPIPTPIARGAPGAGFPYPWSIYGWLEGETAGPGTVHDHSAFAADVAQFLVALRQVDPTGGPRPDRHNFYRGGPLTTYEDETIEAIETVADAIDAQSARAVWDHAMAAEWTGEPVWFHGDVATGNLLVRHGRLSAVVDFGTCGVGDPACDVVLAWTFLSEPSRAAFREGLRVDRDTWSRGRGWALWKALITLAGARDRDPAAAAESQRVLEAVVADHAQEG